MRLPLRDRNSRYKLRKMMLRSLILALSLTSVLGNTTFSYNTTVYVNYTSDVNATLSPQIGTSAGPCFNYTILSESWRNVNSPVGVLHCDTNLAPGTWYRLMAPAGIAIPETIPPPRSCGTAAPMWLNGPHPRNASGVPVERQLCANWEGNPCLWSTTVKVALCPGEYYVYMAPLSAAPACDLAWCAGNTTGISSPRGICEQQGSFYCSFSQVCVPYYHRCNGYSYCSYGEDEAGCYSSSTTAAPTTVSSSCGGTLYGSGYARSPNYPLNYDNSLRCNWTFIANPYNGTIVIQFYEFSTESCCDFVSIYNSNGALVDRYSGSTLPSTVVIGSTAVVGFTTDSSVTSIGFSIWFYTSGVSATTPLPRVNCESQGYFYCASSGQCFPMSYRCNGYTSCYNGEDEYGCSTAAPSSTAASSLCGGTLYGSGYIRSPNYPSNYYNNLRCNWTLIASPYNGNVVLEFSAFSTESCCDRLSIYSSNGSLLYQYYGSSVPATVVLSGTVVITFTTDSSVVYPGFSIWFSTSVASATTPSPRDNCERQGNFYCASSDLCVPISQRCNGYSYCYYGEDEVGCSPSTSAITTQSSSCGGTLYGSGYVRSPYYPSNYDNYLRCNWTLIASPYYGNIVLQFLAFSTESCCDYLSIYNSSGALVYRYSGTSYPNNIVLGSNAIVSFTTDSSVVSSGFSIWFSTSVAATTTLSPRDSCEQQGYFYCALSNLCIAMWRRCDGSTYCYYGEDEAGCGASSTSRSPSTTPSQRDSCIGQGNFYCEFSRECIAMWRRCDGYANCYYGEDEAGCGGTTPTSRPGTGRPAGSEPPQGSFIAASGFAQAFLQLGKSSAFELPRGSWSIVFGCVTALLMGLRRFGLH